MWLERIDEYPVNIFHLPALAGTDVYLIGDIGGTRSRIALAIPGSAQSGLQCVARRIFRNDDFPDLESVLRCFLESEECDSQVTHAALGVAAPVLEDKISMLNRNWHFSVRKLQSNLNLRSLDVFNDFAAIAMALPFLRPSQVRHLGGSDGVLRHKQPQTMGVIGPGTGLGVSGIIPNVHGWSVIEGEGGHATLVAANQGEARLIERLRVRFGHVSAERVISGPGLSWLYDAMTDDAPLGDKPTRHPREVSEDDSEQAREAVSQLLLFLGCVAGNLALTLGAQGGIFIAGGVALKLEQHFAASGFHRRFMDKGRYQSYLAEIPIWLITDEVPAFSGLAAHLDGKMQHAST